MDDYLKCEFCGDRYYKYSSDVSEHTRPDSATHLWGKLSENQQRSASSLGCTDYEGTIITPSDSAEARFGDETWPCDNCSRPLSGDMPTWDAIPEGYRESRAMPMWCEECVPAGPTMISFTAITKMLDLIKEIENK